MARKTKDGVAEELETTVETEEQEVEEKVDAAGEKAKEEAEKEGVPEDEVKKRVEAARKEEKDKLYPQLEELRASLKSMQTILESERAEKEETKKKAQQDAEKKRQESLSAEERQLEAINKLEEQLNREREERLATETRMEAQRKASELREYRQSAIKAAEDRGEKLLPELVRGNSEEEIDAAIEHAKSRYKQLAEEFKQEVADKTKRQMPRSISPGMEALDEEELSEQLSAVDPIKYKNDADYREKIQNEIASVYKRSTGMV